MRSVSSVNAPTYRFTDSRHFALNSATPYSSICGLPEMPSSFSTATSTGRPWQSQPALRSTNRPRMVWKRGNMSLNTRAST